VTPVTQKQKSGVIINISTAWAFEPSALFPTSAVARAGLASFTKIFADTHAADNIRMNNVLPGWIDSLPATEQRREVCRSSDMANPRRLPLPSRSLHRTERHTLPVRTSASMAASRTQYEGHQGSQHRLSAGRHNRLGLACAPFMAQPI
jgi:NAD(P)-dependent dehydrogenase (short-subunit alcohol dehydrogenase family)